MSSAKPEEAPPPKPPRSPAPQPDESRVDEAVLTLLRTLGHDPQTGNPIEAMTASFVTEMVRTALKFMHDGADTGQIKLVTAALKEMRYAYRVFNRYRGTRKISIFGSARTPAGHPDYVAAKRFGELMAGEGWMVITGAGDGIMKAGHEGPARDASFGLAIRLPSEQAANAVIDGDPKLINFRYFFTRKLMFTSNSHAIAVFPGGYGTQDELFEVLTLMQTGKSLILPTVLVEGTDGTYWDAWERFVRDDLRERGWVGPNDHSLYRRCATPEIALREVLGFYRRYRSSRFVRDRLVLRIDAPLSARQLASLNDEFAPIVRDGRIEQSTPLPLEDDALDLPRLHFTFTKRDYAMLRGMIDRVNDMPVETPTPALSSPSADVVATLTRGGGRA